LELLLKLILDTIVDNYKGECVITHQRIYITSSLVHLPCGEN